MKNKQYLNEIAVAFFLVIILIFFWNPWYLWMPDQFVYMAISALAILVVLYAGLVLKEKPQDEREEKLQAQAGRIGFITGVVILSIGVAYQAVTSSPDVFLLLALAAMVIIKVFAFKKSI